MSGDYRMEQIKPNDRLNSIFFVLYFGLNNTYESIEIQFQIRPLIKSLLLYNKKMI